MGLLLHELFAPFKENSGPKLLCKAHPTGCSQLRVKFDPVLPTGVLWIKQRP